jgi:hypothetical protein
MASNSFPNYGARRAIYPELARVAALLNLNVKIYRNGAVTLTSKAKKTEFIDLPIEIRNEIYRLLLVNPLLEESSSVGLYEEFNPHKYELSPALLQVSKQIHHEASSILYGQNRFFLTVIYDSCRAFSPIFRYIRGGFRLDTVLVARKVQQWKVILGHLSQSITAPSG